MINVARRRGCFQLAFLRALLTPIKKKKTFDGSMKNLRPLSIMNVDYKIISKVLSARLRKVLGNIIHCDQSCSIPGRTIHDNVILITSIFEYQQRMRDPIEIALWDQEKAYDRVNPRYLAGVLKTFGFGSVFIGCVRLLYANGSFSIKTNNYISTRFEFISGVRQGCSLPGGLFIICLEQVYSRCFTSWRTISSYKRDPYGQKKEIVNSKM